MPLVVLDRVSLAFGHLPLLDAVSLQVDEGERLCLLGRNGSGKSTLLRVVNGEFPPDAGTVWRQPGIATARLDQDAALSSDALVFDVVSEGLGELATLVTAYHRAAS
ncbi:MAG: ABC transporter ATP-binding protein, partial [Acidobacteria bacterium]